MIQFLIILAASVAWLAILVAGIKFSKWQRTRGYFRNKVMTPTKDELITLAKQIAVAHALDPALVCGMCERESSWNPYALRYEAGYFARYISTEIANHKVSDQTEAQARAFSWGLMQVLGDNFRLRGYEGPFPQVAAMPELGLNYGCIHFAKYLAADAGNVQRALEHWNGGSNLNYANEVLALAVKYR